MKTRCSASVFSGEPATAGWGRAAARPPPPITAAAAVTLRNSRLLKSHSPSREALQYSALGTG